MTAGILEIDMRQMHEAVRKLERVRAVAIPHAARDDGAWAGARSGCKGT